jgi:hypothetical protein
MLLLKMKVGMQVLIVLFLKLLLLLLLVVGMDRLLVEEEDLLLDLLQQVDDLFYLLFGMDWYVGYRVLKRFDLLLLLLEDRVDGLELLILGEVLLLMVDDLVYLLFGMDWYLPIVLWVGIGLCFLLVRLNDTDLL